MSATKLIALPMKETLDKQGIEEEKGILVKDIVEEGELVKENEEKTKEMDVVEVKAHRSPDSRSPQSDAPSSSRSVFLFPFIEMICEYHGSVIKAYHFVSDIILAFFSIYIIPYSLVLYNCTLCTLLSC